MISAFLFFFGLVSLFAQKKKVELCVGYYQTEEEAIKQLERFASTYSNLEEWKKRAEGIRKGIILGSELNKILKKYRKAPFKTIVHSKKILDGYTVENIAIESKPGFYVTGNIYKPENIKGKIPVILCPHGHWSKPEDYGRFRTDMQKRCAAFARMGAVVFTYDMIGYGESTQYEHQHPKALQILAKHLGLDYDKILNDRGEVDESFVILLPMEELLVFDNDHQRPENAISGNEAVTRLLDRK